MFTRGGGDHSTAPVDQSPTTTFVSPRHGYSVQYPDGAVVTPATNFFWDPRSRRTCAKASAQPSTTASMSWRPASGAVFTGGVVGGSRGGVPNRRVGLDR